MRRMLLCLLLLMPIFQITAQEQRSREPTSSLLTMLESVPDTIEVRQSFVTYIDYRAMESIRGIETPTVADFEDATELSGLWVATSIGFAGGVDLSYAFAGLGDMQAIMGFDMFDIDQSLTFGNLPNDALLIRGDFDTDAIQSAFIMRDYVSETVDDAVLLCPADGCDTGQLMDIMSRQPANLFGGRLGQSHPVAILPDGIVVSSAAEPPIDAMLSTYSGEIRSLADDIHYRTLAEAAQSMGTLAQFAYLSPGSIIDVDPFTAFNLEIETLEEYYELLGLPESESLIPPYTLAAFADVGTANEQIAIIALMYENLPDAETAAPALKAQLESANSLRTRSTFIELIEARDGSIGDAVIYEGDGSYVVMLPVRYPLPSNEHSETGFGRSSMIYRLFMESYFSRDTAYLIDRNTALAHVSE